jgi:hypothetical protein
VQAAWWARRVRDIDARAGAADLAAAASLIALTRIRNAHLELTPRRASIAAKEGGKGGAGEEEEEEEEEEEAAVSGAAALLAHCWAAAAPASTGSAVTPHPSITGAELPLVTSAELGSLTLALGVLAADAHEWAALLARLPAAPDALAARADGAPLTLADWVGAPLRERLMRLLALPDASAPIPSRASRGEGGGDGGSRARSSARAHALPLASGIATIALLRDVVLPLATVCAEDPLYTLLPRAVLLARGLMPPAERGGLASPDVAAVPRAPASRAVASALRAASELFLDALAQPSESVAAELAQEAGSDALSRVRALDADRAASLAALRRVGALVDASAPPTRTAARLLAPADAARLVLRAA